MVNIYIIQYTRLLDDIKTFQELIKMPKTQFLNHNKNCYVFYHFGEKSKTSQLLDVELPFNDLKTDELFCVDVENKFNVHINFINLEPIINEIVKFNKSYPNMAIIDNVESVECVDIICYKLMMMSYNQLKLNVNKFKE